MSTKETDGTPQPQSAPSAGNFDPTFGNNGVVALKLPDGTITSVPISGIASNLTSDVDHRIYVGAWENETYIIRLLPDGEIDKSFASAGYLTLPRGGAEDARLTIETFIPMESGKIIGWGIIYKFSPSHDRTFIVPAAVCFTADGVLDTAFGINGLATYKELIPKTTSTEDLSSQSQKEPLPVGLSDIEKYDGAGRPAVSRAFKQVDGKLLLCGKVSYPIQPYDIASYLLKINIDGSLDKNFGQDGILLIRDPDYSALPTCDYFDIDRRGGIVVAGTHYRAVQPILIARYDSEGHADRGFGKNGVVHINNPAPYASQSRGVIALDDGKIIVMAAFFVSDIVDQHAIAIKLLPNGDRDPAFNNGEPVSIDVLAARRCTLDDGNRIVFAGEKSGDGTACISRVLPNGALDTGFGLNGTVELERFQWVRLVAIQNRVNILAVSTDRESEPPQEYIFRIIG